MEQKEESWLGKNYAFFQNKACEYFPCHTGIDPKDFNCLFCFCPLYTLGTACGGAFSYTEKGVKICTDCPIPHRRENYGRVVGRYRELIALAKAEQNNG